MDDGELTMELPNGTAVELAQGAEPGMVNLIVDEPGLATEVIVPLAGLLMLVARAVEREARR